MMSFKWKILIFSLSFVISSIGCYEEQQHPMNLIILVDLSSSMGEHNPTGSIKEITREWLEKVIGRGGGSLEILIINHGIEDIIYHLHMEVPPKFEVKGRFSLAKKEFYEKFNSILEEKIAFKGNNRGSAIIHAIYRATEIFRLMDGRKILVIISDLRHVSPGLNFERKVPGMKEVYCWLRKNGLEIDLSGVKVFVLGFRPYPQNKTTTPLTLKSYIKLRKLWVELFESWGAAKVVISDRIDFEKIFRGGVD
jgi:hypothetical protein